MPLARIDLPAGKPASYRQAVGAVIYEAMTDVLKVPKDDRFQIFAEHSRAEAGLL
ncbi:MAG TPA: tautomerase family protein [Aliidongia sp.]|nr:tautomerase family protein [Aliidongia sp.]